MEEERKTQFQESYDKPLMPIPRFLKTFVIKIFSFVLSMIFGRFINIERLMKCDEKRVQ